MTSILAVTAPFFALVLCGWLAAHGYAGDTAERHRLLDDDIDLNVQGLEVWLDRS